MEADRALAQLARRQHALVSDSQLRDAGITNRQIKRRVAIGDLGRFAPGVLAVAGSPPTELQACMAPILVRSEAFVSGASAGWMFGVPGAGLRPVQVTSTGPRLRWSGTTWHKSNDPWGVTEFQGIRVSGPARLMFELANRDIRLAEAALDHLLAGGFVGSAELLAEAHARYGRKQPGSSPLRSLLDRRWIEDNPTDSQLEGAFNSILEEFDIAGFEFHRRVRIDGASWEPDFVNAALRIIVEVDGFGSHASRHAFGRDREHDSRATASGWASLRFTWHQVTYERHVVAKRLMSVVQLRSAA